MFAWSILACGYHGAPVTTMGTPRADAVNVAVTGSEGDYTFGVTIRSDETGCDQYADWWEVVSPEGDLLYRRILGHSHPSEQPFTRTGGPVPVGAEEEIVVRAHLHRSEPPAPSGGYEGTALRGSVASGFEAWAPPPGFAEALAAAAPLPEGCLF